MMTLTGKQKAYLKKTAHPMSPLFQIGKHGVTEELTKQIEDALEKRELIKVSLLQNTDVTTKEAGEEIQEATGADIVQTIGKVLVLYKKSSKEKNQKISSGLPK